MADALIGLTKALLDHDAHGKVKLYVAIPDVPGQSIPKMITPDMYSDMVSVSRFRGECAIPLSCSEEGAVAMAESWSRASTNRNRGGRSLQWTPSWPHSQIPNPGGHTHWRQPSTFKIVSVAMSDAFFHTVVHGDLLVKLPMDSTPYHYLHYQLFRCSLPTEDDQCSADGCHIRVSTVTRGLVREGQVQQPRPIFNPVQMFSPVERFIPEAEV